MPEQLVFDFRAAAPRREKERSGRVRNKLRRATLRWLLQEHSPTGCAAQVITRMRRFQADIAAFWSRSTRNRNVGGPAQLLVPERTVLIQCFGSRQECWPDCTQSEKLLPELRQLKQQLEAMETQIRNTEPQLRATDTLFEEFAEWRYADSVNSQYHQLKRQETKVEDALYAGTTFERLRAAEVADELYLAVPTNMVMPDELAEGWGLLWIHDDMTVSEILAPQKQCCCQANRLHLVQNIAAAATSAVMDRYGLRLADDGVAFVKPARRHRKERQPSLCDKACLD